MSQRNYSSTLSLFVALFFLAGVITSLNEILNPFFKNQFELGFAEAALTQFSFYLAFLVLGIPAGALIQRWGYRKTALLGLGILGTGIGLFFPAMYLNWFPLFLVAVFTVACGIAILMILSNPYVALMGSPQTASSRLNLANGFHSVGTVIGPVLGAGLITARAAEMGSMALELPYAILAAIVLFFLFIMWRAHIPEFAFEEKAKDVKDSLWKYPHFVWGILAIFLYVGAEVGIGSIMIKYLSLPEVGNLSEATAGRYLSLYWGGSMLGRFVGIVVLRYIATQKALTVNALLAIGMLSISILTTGPLAMWSLILLGLCHSIMFANIFALATRGLGDLTARASGILLSAAVGGAVMPFIQGGLADSFGLKLSLLLPLLAYVYVLLYSRKA